MWGSWRVMQHWVQSKKSLRLGVDISSCLLYQVFVDHMPDSYNEHYHKHGRYVSIGHDSLPISTARAWILPLYGPYDLRRGKTTCHSIQLEWWAFIGHCLASQNCIIQPLSLPYRARACYGRFFFELFGRPDNWMRFECYHELLYEKKLLRASRVPL